VRRATPYLLVLALTANAPPAWAVKEWYDYYQDARDKLIPREQYEKALESLQAAVRLKPRSGLNERTYGLDFLHYIPYYQMGVCYLGLEDFAKAKLAFDDEERQQAIKREPRLFQELVRLRQEAEDREAQRIGRLLRQEVRQLVEASEALWKQRKFEQALARLAEAEVAAEALDPQTQGRIRDLKEAIRADAAALAAAQARAKRIDDALTEGLHLLETRQPTEAIVRFDEVLSLDSENARATEGKRRAQERILASRTRQALQARFQEGKALVEAGRYQHALAPLTEAATDPSNTEARELLERAQRTVERIREQRELRLRIQALFDEGERLLTARKYPEAQVQFESALNLDPGNLRVQERFSFAERMTGDAVLARWIPNNPPVLTIIEPRSLTTELEGSTAALIGVATDDRALEKVELKLGGRVLAVLSPPRRVSPEESLRSLRFRREFPLEPGANEISVVATDSLGLQRSETFKVTRHLRLYERDEFFPSALATALGLVGLGFVAQYARRRRARRNRFNPYIAGAPVLDDAMFFGREKLMNRMLNVLHHNSLMITGERRIGKTTFLYHLKKALTRDDVTDYRFFPVFTDLQGVPEDGLFHAVMSDVVDTLELKTETASSLRFRADEEGYDGRDFSHDLQRVIAELKKRTSKRVKLALLIDEVDVLNQYSERINQRLRGIFMKTFSEHMVAIMSGVGVRRTWNSEGSPWYNFFDEVELEAFTREEAEALVRTPVSGVFRYSNEAVQVILDHSQLKPYVIQKLCVHAVNRMLEGRRTVVTADDVEAVRESVPLEGHDPAGTPALSGRPASA